MFVWKLVRIWFAALAICALMALVGTAAALAGTDTTAADENVPTLNLSSQNEADAFAKELVARYEAEAAEKGIEPSQLDPILIVHVGARPPEQLKWIMLHLEAAKIPASLEIISEEEMQKNLADSRDRALADPTFLTYDKSTAEKRKGALRQVFDSAVLKTKQVFGLPNGLTAWVKIKRSSKLKLLEGGLASINTLIAGASVTWSFYLSQHSEGLDVHPLRAGLFVAGWTWYMLYEGRRFSELMSQAKVLKETAPGSFKSKNSKLFSYAASTLRSLISNAIVMSAAFGVESVMNIPKMEHSMWNSTVSMFARGWIDDWFATKMPTLNEDGTTTVEAAKGQWSLRKWTIINSIFNVTYAFGKNVNLLFPSGGWVDYTYYV
ncbi:MAG: hypothetical protein HY074_01915, partial [Deltaproteobacteria bacterium]|nr:hypothetical protein [Deltaproteobacteria bacterium]